MSRIHFCEKQVRDVFYNTYVKIVLYYPISVLYARGIFVRVYDSIPSVPEVRRFVVGTLPTKFDFLSS